MISGQPTHPITHPFCPPAIIPVPPIGEEQFTIISMISTPSTWDRPTHPPNHSPILPARHHFHASHRGGTVCYFLNTSHGGEWFAMI